jgi:autotransporter-associated beta strand protein
VPPYRERPISLFLQGALSVIHSPRLDHRRRTPGGAVIATFACVLLAVAGPGADAQIVVGGTGSDTTDSTNYSGSQSLTKIGSNTVTLTGTNSYSGGTVVNAGSLAIPATGNLGTGTVTLSGGTLAYGGPAATLTRQVAVTTDSGITVTSGSTLTWAGNVNGDGTLVVAGPGTLLFNGSYDNGVNGIRVTSGTLRSEHTNNYFLLAYQRGTGGGIDAGLLEVGPAGTAQIAGSAQLAGTPVLYPTTTYANTPVVIGGGTMSFVDTSSVGQNNPVGKVTFTNGGVLDIQVNNRVDLNSLGGIVSGGTGSATISGSGQLNIVKRASGDAPTIDVAATAPLRLATNTVSNAVGSSTGNLPITKTGEGTLDLAASLQTRGGVVISGGTIRFAGDSTINYLGNLTPVTVDGGVVDYGGFLEANGAALTLKRGLITNGTAVATSYAVESGTVSAVLSGGGDLTKSTAGTVVLSGSNSFSGSTFINSGTLKVGDGGATGSLGGGAVSNSASLVYDRSGVVDQAGAISGTGSVSLVGSGTVDLKARLAAGGGVSIQSGALRFASSSSVDYIGLGTPVTVAGGALDLGGYAETTGAPLTLSSGVITNGTANATQFALASGTMSAGLSGTGSITKTTAGTVVLSGSSSASGPVAVGAGVLEVAGVNRLATTGTVTIDSGAVLRVSGAQQLARIQGAGEVNIASGSLTVGSEPQVFAGSITGAGSVVKAGSATMSLSGSNTYAGGTIVAGGNLIALSSNALGSGAVTLRSGTLQYGTGVTIPNDLVLAGSASSTLIGPISSFDYVVVGGGAGGAGSDGGGGGGSGGVLSNLIGRGTALGTSGTYAVKVGAGGAGGVNLSRGADGGDSSLGAIVAIGGGPGGPYNSTPGYGGSGGGGGSGIGGTFGGAGTAGQGSTGGNAASGTSSALNAGGGGGGAGNVGGNGVANTGGGAGGSGVAVPILSVADAAALGIGEVSSNVVWFGGGGGGSPWAGTGLSGGGGGVGGGGAAATGDGLAGSAGVTNTGGGGGASRSTVSPTYVGGAGGSGVVVVRYPGSPIATGGTIIAGSGTTAGYTLHAFASGSGNLVFNAPAGSTFSGNLSGTGGFTWSTPAKLTLTGSNTYAGGTVVTSGTVQVGDGGSSGSLGTGRVSLNGATLIYDRAGTFTEPYEISGTSSSAVIKRGSGTLVLSGTSGYAGPTTVEAGGLAVNGNLASSLTSILSGATLSGVGLINGTVTIAGNHAPGNSPGTQSFTDNVTYLGGAGLTWELAGNTASASSRGTLYDGVNLTGGNLAFSGSTAMSLSFDGGGSLVDWADPFWATSRSGTNGWLVYDMTTGIATGGTTTGASFLAISGSSWLDANGVQLLAARPYASFGLEQVGQDVYLTFTAVPEPAAVGLAGIGAAVASVGLLRRRRELSPRRQQGRSERPSPSTGRMRLDL